MSKQSIYEEEKKKTIELLKDCDSWENGLTMKEMSKAVFNSNGEQSMRKMRSVMRIARHYFVMNRPDEENVPPLYLMWKAKGVKGKKQRTKTSWRWFLTQTNEDAFYAEETFAIQFKRVANKTTFAAVALDPLLTNEQRKRIAIAFNEVSRIIQSRSINLLEEENSSE